MSIAKAMYAGVSGLSAESDTLSIVGDNVANANTIGFKKARAMFENILGGAIGSSDNEGGVKLGASQQIFAQGALINTGQATDAALSGDGFFVVHGTVGGVTGDYYTRAGQFTVRNDGVLVNPEGMSVQGNEAQPDGTYKGGALSPITLSTAQLPPKSTTKLTITANLDAAAPAPSTAWDPQNPSSGSNLSTSMTVYDSLGKAHSLDVYFTAKGGGGWDAHVLAKGDDIAGGPAGKNVEIGTGSLTFDSSGALQSVNWSTNPTASFSGATANQAFSFDFGSPTATGGTGLGGTTQFGAASEVSAQSQDGYGSGDLSGVKIDADGVVSGVYSNGQTVAAGKLAVAKFRSNEGLAKAGQSLWAATRDSGDAAIGGAGEGGRGSIVAGSLEQSNVDIAGEFVDMIAHQRAFQANSKTITTADQMLQELMTIKQ